MGERRRATREQPVSESHQTLIRARELRKGFGGTQALKSLNFELRAGQIHALIGENGAGKSTFIKILAGLHGADGGTLDLDPSVAAHHGIAFIHQDLGLIPSMSVADNVMLGERYPRRGGLIDWRAARRESRDWLQRVSAGISPRTPIDALPAAERALVAIARALRRRARVLVLDEPTAMLPGTDVGRLFTVLRELRAEGLGIIYVSHRLRELLSIADAVTVIRDGTTQCEGLARELSERDLIELMTGQPVDAATHAEGAHGDQVTFTARALSAAGLLPTDLTLHAGEIVGCVGLRGAGQDRLGAALFGLLESDGTMELDGAPYAPSSPQHALASGVTLISGSREKTLVATMSVAENFLVNPSFSLDRRWLRRPKAQLALVRRVLGDYDVRPPIPTKNVAELSGGNAQKLVFARGLETSPRLVVLEDPTAGVDMPTRRALYALMRERARAGVAFLVVSSDHEEVAQVCDRIHIFRAGRMGDAIDGPADPEQLARSISTEAQ
jgi:ribose transport system ATP-binding protein